MFLSIWNRTNPCVAESGFTGNLNASKGFHAWKKLPYSRLNSKWQAGGRFSKGTFSHSAFLLCFPPLILRNRISLPPHNISFLPFLPRISLPVRFFLPPETDPEILKGGAKDIHDRRFHLSQIHIINYSRSIWEKANYWKKTAKANRGRLILNLPLLLLISSPKSS